MNTSIKAILFDMDGTLVDTEPMGGETMRNFLNKNNITLSADEWQLFDKVWRRDGAEMTTEEWIVGIYKKYLNISDVKEYIADFYQQYENNILLAKPLAGAHEALEYLKKHYTLALVTASTASQTKLILKNNGWENFFTTIVSHDDYQKSKPDPESFLMAASQLQVPPEQCVVVEDSKNGALAGKNAGMLVIGVRAGNKYAQDLSAAKLVLETLHDIQTIL